VRVDPETSQLKVFAPPKGTPYMNLNTAAFDSTGILWFTGQSGYYGRVNPNSDRVEVFDAPRGRGPYGIATAPDGSVYYASLAGSHIARIDVKTGQAQVLEPPTKGQGARRVWADSKGNIWVSEWNVGQLARYTPRTRAWKEWRLPGAKPRAYAVYVDEKDTVWVSDFGDNAIVRFDPETEKFQVFDLPSPNAKVRQILGRSGEVWLPESAVDKLAVIRTAN
jgi:virginiamycin B lyase